VTANVGIYDGVQNARGPINSGADASTFLRGDGRWTSAGALNVAQGQTAVGGTGNLIGIPNTATTYTGSGTRLQAADRLCIHPMQLVQPITIDSAHIEVTGAVASTNVVIGLYSAGVRSSRFVANRLITQFGGELSSATTGIKSVTGLRVELDPGVYCLAWVTNGAPTLRTLSGVPTFGLSTVGNSGSSNVYQSVFRYSYASTYSDRLPQNAPDTLPVHNVDGSPFPTVFSSVWLGWSLR
jgi:hypothetical protein